MCSVGASEGSRQVTPSSQAHPQSSFASHLCRMMDENEADCRTVDAFDKELLQLRRCDRRKMKMNGQHSHRGRQRTRQSLREASIQSSSSISLDRDKNICSNGDQKGRAASTCSLRHLSEKLASLFPQEVGVFYSCATPPPLFQGKVAALYSDSLLDKMFCVAHVVSLFYLLFCSLLSICCWVHDLHAISGASDLHIGVVFYMYM
ncbi:hypothetical protein CK203_070096 [Vitis vinifera]|uniref:Uncharacterized protein n=1 Tax=Vitis vinifera TaxID=29760 RepID=A0A438EHH0_VITVI|nr:hypothetical protein CK203_070096 [Vitis vinifera]